MAYTRVLYLHTSSDDDLIALYLSDYFTNENGIPITTIVECTLFTDFGTAPYYVNANMNDCVAFYQDGTMKVLGNLQSTV